MVTARPRAALDLVHGQERVRGVAVLVELDGAGRTLEADVGHGREDRCAEVLARDLGVLGQCGLERLDDGVRSVVGLGAVRGVRVGVASLLVGRDEVGSGVEVLGRRTDRGRDVTVAATELDVGRVEDAVTTHERDGESAGGELCGERPGLRVLTAVVDELGVRRGDRADDGGVVLLVRVDHLGDGDLSRRALSNSSANTATRPAPYVFWSWMIATFGEPRVS